MPPPLGGGAAPVGAQPWRRRMRRPLLRLLVLVPLALTALPGPAHASQQLGDVDVRGVTLQVNARGQALISYTRSRRAPQHARLARDQRPCARPERAAGALLPRLHRRAPSLRRASGNGSGTPAARTTARGWSCSSPHARRLTARTGRCSAGSGCCRCAASSRGSRRSAPTSCTSRTGRVRCPIFEASPELDLRRLLAGRLRPADVSRRAGLRLPDALGTRSDPLRATSTSTRSTRLRPGLATRHGDRHASRNGAFCYSFAPQAPPAGYPTREPRGPGNGQPAPPDRNGAGRHTRRAVGRPGTPRSLRPRRRRPLQRVVRPPRRAGRPRLHTGALGASGSRTPRAPLAPRSRRPPLDPRPAWPFAAPVDEPLDRLRLALEDGLDAAVALFRTQPATRDDSARRRIVSRKKTPCTRPVMVGGGGSSA